MILSEKNFEKWASNSDKLELKDTCSPEMDLIVKKYVYQWKTIFDNMTCRKHGNCLDSPDVVEMIVRGFGGECTITGIALTDDKYTLEIDRIKDSSPYAVDKIWVVFNGINCGKNCGNQGEDNNIFQTEETFNIFVKGDGSKNYGLHINNDFNDNVAKYVRYFWQRLVVHCKEIQVGKLKPIV